MNVAITSHEGRGSIRRFLVSVGHFIVYAFARSFFAWLALMAVLIGFLWSPWAACFLAIIASQLVTRIEQVPLVERLCGRITRSAPQIHFSFLSHPEDLHALIFNAVLFTAYGVAFWAWIAPAPNLAKPCDKFIFALGSGVMLGWAAGVNLGVNYHNHLHNGIFRSRWLNEWMGRLWTLPSGWPSYFWKHKHLVVHHRHVGEAEDWVQPKRRANGSYENLYHYIFFHWPWRYGIHFFRDYRHSSPTKRRRIAREFLLFLPFWLTPFLIDPWMGVALWLFPHWIGSAFILGCGMYTQHVGGTNTKEHSHSTTFLSRFFNLTMFNVGYHTEHHARPASHWAELPVLHDTLREELIAGGAHIVGYGSYTATRLLKSLWNVDHGLAEFRQQHPEYRTTRQAIDMEKN